MVQDTALLDFINEVQMYYTGAQVSATALTSMTSQMRAGTIRKCDMASIYTYQSSCAASWSGLLPSSRHGSRMK